jgi:hypothetical protein
MNDNDKLEYFIKEGLLNDELILLYRNGILTSKEIQDYIINTIKFFTI